jgi:hypothetical protein
MGSTCIEMRATRDRDVRRQQGRIFGLVYHISEEIDDLLKEAYTMFFAENGLSPTALPSLHKAEGFPHSYWGQGEIWPRL